MPEKESDCVLNPVCSLAILGEASYSYTYNGENDRVSQTVGSTATQFTLDLNSDLADVLSDGTNLYIPGIGQANIDGSDPEFYLADANNSTRLVTDATGTVVGDPQNYDPFGNTTDTPSSPVGYSGEWKDASGLIYLRARYYDPGMGRFISKDPFSGNMTDPASMNGFNYADDDPIDGSDPSGKCDWFRSFTDPNYSLSEARADCARDEYLANFAQQNGYGLGLSTLIRLGNIEALNDELSAINSGENYINQLFSECPDQRTQAWKELGYFMALQKIPMLAGVYNLNDQGIPEPDYNGVPPLPYNNFADFTPEDWAQLRIPLISSLILPQKNGQNYQHKKRVKIPSGTYLAKRVSGN